jgi:hypothetical protein
MEGEGVNGLVSIKKLQVKRRRGWVGEGEM